jgi:hypothetical protein
MCQCRFWRPAGGKIRHQSLCILFSLYHLSSRQLRYSDLVVWSIVPSDPIVVYCYIMSWAPMVGLYLSLYRHHVLKCR